MVLAETPRIAIKTPLLAGSINLKGARIDDLVLTGYSETIKKDSPPIRLLSPGGSPDAYFAGFGWSGDGVALPGPDTVWMANAQDLTPGSPVTLSWTNPTGQTFAIRIAVDQKYMFTIDQTVTNKGAAPVAVRPYSLISRVGVSKDPSTWTMHTGPSGAFGGAADYSVDFKDLDEAGADGTHFNAVNWLGFGDKYWLTALAPATKAPTDAAFRAGSGKRYQAELAAQTRIVPPGKALSVSDYFFAGAKEVYVLGRL